MKRKFLSLILSFAMISSLLVFAPVADAAAETIANEDFSGFTSDLPHSSFVASAYDGASFRTDGWGTAWQNSNARYNSSGNGGMDFSIVDDGTGANRALRVERKVFRGGKTFSNGSYDNGYYDTATSAWVGTSTQPDSGARVIKKLDSNFTYGTLNTSFKVKFAGGAAQEVEVGFGGLASTTGYSGIKVRKSDVVSTLTHSFSGDCRLSYGKTLKDDEWHTVNISINMTTALVPTVTVSVTGLFEGDTEQSTVSKTFKMNTGQSITASDIGHIYFKSDRTQDLADYGSLGTTYTTSVWYIDDIVVTKEEPINAAAKINWSDISNNQSQTEVLDNLNLVKSVNVDGTDYAISWATTDAAAVSTNGTVYPGAAAKTVTLTASDTLGNSKSFDVKVLPSDEINKYLVRADFDKYALGDARNAVIWTHKYNAYNTCYTNFNVIEDDGSRALHVERTVFKSSGYKDQTGATVTGVYDPDANDRIMPAMKENVTSDEKIQIDTRVKFLDSNAAVGIRFDGMDSSGFAPLVELHPYGILNPIDGFRTVNFGSTFDAGKYIDFSVVMDFLNSKITVTATGESAGTLKTQTLTSAMSKVVMDTLDIDSIGLIYRRDSSPSLGSYVDYFRVKDITASPLDAITWDAISNAQGIANVTEAVKLDKTVTYNNTEYNVTWTSSNEAVITSNGAVARPFMDTAVTLTATLDSGDSKSFNTVVRSTEPAVVSANFDDYNVANGTVINGLGSEWEEVYPSGVLKGVNYTVAQDPTDADNQVMKSERFIMMRGGDWVDGTTGAAAEGALDTYGPAGNDIARVMFDEAVTEGKVTLSTRVMFTEGTGQSIDFFLYDLYDVNANNNVLLLDRTNFKFYGYKNSYISYGGFKAIPYVWYNVAFTVDIDNGTYELKIGDLTFSGIEAISDDDMEQLTGIGIYSNRTQDTAATGTSVWYVDDVVVKKGLSNANAVELAKKELSLPETVTGDIALPTSGLEETTITWATSDDKVITETGVVTYSDTDKTVKLIATIEKGTASDTKEFTITVPGVKAYAVKAVNVLTPSGDTGKSLIGGGKITSVDVYRHYATDYTAKVYVALYESDGRLFDVTTAELTSNAVGVKERATITLDETISLPEDITGLTMKAFVWSGIVPVSNAFDNATPETDIFIIGDSIACYYPASAYPQQGWGEYLDEYLNDKVTIHNKAHGGYSTRTYLETTSTDNWASVKPEISAGDYVLISLGHNDANTGSDTRYTSIDQYKENLRIFINETRALDAIPILITNSVALQATNLGQTNITRVTAMNEVGSEMGVVCLDLNKKMYDEFTGKDMAILKSDYYISGDYLHFNEVGANYVAGLIIDLLGETDSELAKYIK